MSSNGWVPSFWNSEEDVLDDILNLAEYHVDSASCNAPMPATIAAYYYENAKKGTSRVETEEGSKDKYTEKEHFKPEKDYSKSEKDNSNSEKCDKNKEWPLQNEVNDMRKTSAEVFNSTSREMLRYDLPRQRCSKKSKNNVTSPR